MRNIYTQIISEWFLLCQGICLREKVTLLYTSISTNFSKIIVLRDWIKWLRSLMGPKYVIDI